MPQGSLRKPPAGGYDCMQKPRADTENGSFENSFHVKPFKIVIINKFYREFLKIIPIAEKNTMRYNIKRGHTCKQMS